MAGKTISTSTLGLRFMQNAQRAKQLKEVEFERAEVTDDGQWEVAQEVRNAWGLVSGRSSQSVDHETSYLPFLFPSLTDASEQPESSSMAQRPKGRRKFDKKGLEVIQSTESESVAGASEKDSEKQISPESSSKKSKIHPRPISISESSGKLLSGFPSKNAKTAKQAIYDNTGVGTDLRPPKVVPRAQSSSSVFLKPSGVDDPADTKPHEASSSNCQSDTDVIAGARNKRQRPTNDHRDGEGAKRKKKKKKSVD